MKFYIFCSTDQKPDFVSKGIMKTLKTNYSHVGVILVKEDQHVYLDGTVYHSVGDGMGDIPVMDFIEKKKKRFVEIYDVTPYIVNPDRALGWMEGNKGKDYSESQYVAIILNKMGLRGLSKYFFDSESELVCSEFAYLFLNYHTSLEEFKCMDQDLVTPRDVIDKLRQRIKAII